MFTIFVFIYLPYKTYFKFSTCFTLIFFYYHLCWCSFAVECLCYHSLEPWFHTFYFLCVELAGILSECYVILFPVILLLYSLILLYSLHSLSFFFVISSRFSMFLPKIIFLYRKNSLQYYFCMDTSFLSRSFFSLKNCFTEILFWCSYAHIHRFYFYLFYLFILAQCHTSVLEESQPLSRLNLLVLNSLSDLLGHKVNKTFQMCFSCSILLSEFFYNVHESTCLFSIPLSFP